MKENALAEMKYVCPAVVGDFGQGFRRQRRQLGGPRQIVIPQQRLVRLLDDSIRIVVGDLDRVESGFLDLEGDAKHFVRIRGTRNRRGRGDDKTAQQSGDEARETGLGIEHSACLKLNGV